TLLFCSELDAWVKDPKAPVTVEYEPAERQNVAVVGGAYLVLGQGWSAEQVRGALPADAQLAPPCSWSSPEALQTQRGSPRMRVQDCWEGAQMAKGLGWLHSDSVTDSVMTSFAAAKYWRAVQQCDGSWLVPGAIFVMADPMTTISDPDPKTCGTFCRNDTEDHLPEMEDASADDLQRPSWCESVPSSPEPTARRTSFTEIRGGRGQRIPEMEEASADDPVSLGAQVSGRRRPSIPELDEASLDGRLARAPGRLLCEAEPSVDLLLEEGMRGVVRVSSPNEGGLAQIGGSCDPGLLTRAGLWPADVPASDR
ncbi:unnamed protein product, partial [Prorocentrum cordatum]